ncbi:hypothetical protein B0T14DRAFT_432757 [Immersiella caudata]|uniref:Polyketide synthase n=1 Tax=Immersiella caudata TaxID=314043 RepID=A0AA39WSL2_9PEZI|nr:hypothetical protein B0T14DRAFT_432757 [Immersiella caudata]
MEASVPIAIVGMSCRFAGDVDNPQKLWRLLAEGRSAWSEIPKSRFNVDGVFHPNFEKLNGTNVVGGHFLTEDVGLFDAHFFNLSAETAAALDPQFRLQLESTYEAFESAGITLEDVAGSNTSVFAGSFFRDYHESLVKDPDTLPRFLLMGTGAAMAANRLSHFFDLRGPSMALDTGCSTTLVGLHQGCQSLRTGESDMSVVGGANVMFNPDMFLAMSSMTLISKDGKSYAFDSRANGYGRGEGSATVILKRLDDALRDGNPIRAIIRDSGLNQDGKTETITTPSGEAQEALIRACYKRAGLDPSLTTYFEAHGTGTPTGDPIEVKAIASVFSDSRPADQPLRIGSVKTNIGHTETASGVAAVIKVVLALENGQIPPSINFKRPNEKLHLEDWRLKVPTELEPWPERDGVRRASVNNFGYGGSNAHAILEDYRSFLASKRREVDASAQHANGRPENGNGSTNGHASNGRSNGSNGHRLSFGSEADEVLRSRVFVLSGKDERVTQTMATNLKEYLLRTSPEDPDRFLDDLAYTLCHRRSRFPWSTTFSGESVDDIIKTLDSGKTKPVKTGTAPRIGFVYTGQGAQWWAMGRELINAYPVFKAALMDCDTELKKLGTTWNMIEELNRDAATSKVNELDYSTPVCVAVQIALTHLLRSWGIVPTAVTSHSSGEIAAAYAAGALDLPSAMAIVFARGGLASDMNRQLARKGGMVAVGLGVETSKKYLSAVTNGQVVVACENSPSSITVSGDVPGLDQLEAVLKRDNIFARRLKVDAAWHSHHMEAVADAYYASMDKKIRAAQNHLDFVFSSPSTGVRMENVGEIGSPAHWVNSLTGPVKFVDAFRNMCFDDSDSGEATVDMVIEVGPHAALSGPIQDIMMLPEFKGINIPYASCLIRKQSAVATMQSLVGTLFQKGYPVNLAPVNFPLGIYGLRVLHDLPRYPWNHQTRHWVEPRANRAHRQRIDSHHDLLGSLVLGTNMETPTWRHIVRLSDLPWVRDHVVQNNRVYPAAGFVAMAIEGMAFLSSRKHAGRDIVGYELRDVDILNALLVPETNEGIEVQLQLRPCNKKDISTLGWTEFQVQSVTTENKWTDHCQGIISVQYAAMGDAASSTPDGTQQKLDQPMRDSDYRVHINPQDVYADLRAGGICHGPIFRNMKSIRARQKQSVVTFSVADTAAVMPKGYQHQHVIHPSTLDSVFQAVYTAVPGAGSKLDIPRVPRSVGKLWVAHNVVAQPDHSFKAYVNLSHIDPQSTTTSLTVVDESPADGGFRPVVRIDGFVYQSIGNVPARTVEPWITEKFAAVKWAPDITFLKETFLGKQLGSELSTEEARMLMDLRRACLLFIYDALQELTASDLQRLEWYHKKFYIWMRLQVELARTNELGPDSSKWGTVSGKEKAQILERVRADSTNGEMVCKLGPHITAILRGEVTALELMLEKSLLSRYYLDGLKWGRANEKLGEMVRHFAHKHPRAKMIEIGGGTGGATSHVLNALGTENPAAASYDFTDVSSGFFEAAKEKFQDWRDLVRYKKLDIEQDPSKQGFEQGTYDVVIACQVLHATKCMKTTMTHVRKLLKPGGKLFIMETTQDQLDIQFVFGFLSGWWLSEEEERKFSPSLTVPMWDRVLHQSGFRGVETEVRDCEDDELYSFSVISSTATAPPPKFDFEISFITPAGAAPDDWLDKLRLSIGLLTCTVPTVQTLEEATYDNNRVCIFVDSPDTPVLGGASAEQFEGLKKMCTVSKGLLWLSRGGAGECANPLASLASGFLRSVRQEYTGKRLGTLDLDPLQPAWSSESVQTVTEVFKRFFDLSAKEILDYEFSDRDGVVHVPRYVKDVERNEDVFGEPISQPVPKLEPFVQADRPLKLTIGTTGLLDTLAFDDDPTAAENLPDDFVEIDPKAFGVNFRDVMTAMGQLKSRVMGYDCAGVITRAGPVAAANGHKKGDRVSVLLRGHYGSRARVHWASAVQIPDSMSFEVAASLPTQYVTAYLSLYDTARLQEGERVLVHSATGGVGQAAVMLSQRIGAEVFVTVGSEEKRNFVMTQFGIPADHIFNSRDTSFAAGILATTGGKGVDVVLNSLAGNLLQESFNCLAPFGRFVELGKRDFELNHSLSMEAFTRAVSFSSIDLIRFGEQKPLHANRILKDVVKLVGAGEVNAVHPISVYPISAVEKAFRLMQAGKHMGKIVLLVTPDVMVPVLPRTKAVRLRSDASYMVVGGFGGIGRSICRWLAEQGAEQLVVVSRSANNAEKTRRLQSELDDLPHEVKVTAIGCDISNTSQLKKELDAYRASGAPAIRGIIHGGMELRDSVLERMTLDEHNAALGPKLHGSWNLHQFFSQAGDLDFYVMLSSLIGIVGFASQSNYSAGGAFQDALAQHRARAGLPGVSIDLGIVTSVGYLAGSGAEKTIESLQRHGFTALSESDILAAIGSAITTPFAGQLTLGLNTGPTAQKDYSPLAMDMRFSALRYQETGTDGPSQTAKTGAGDLAASIAEASTLEQAVTAIVAGIAKKLMDIFMISEDEVVPTKSPADYGVDSLVAVEFRNMLALKAGAELSIFDIMQSPSLTTLAATVAAKSSHISPSLLST